MPPSTTIVIEDALQELFTDLHASKLFADGKVISDVVLKASPEVILVAYRTAKQAANFDLMAFFNAHFEKSPELESNYQSDTSLSVEEHIRRLWPVLTRQVNTITKGKYSTRIPLPYPYIVPGGRFNEIYYWDSYFTMLGLQTHGNVDRIECMVNNFSWLIEEYGFIPNGNRTYFLGRSQPPFYALMVDLLAQEKGDEILLKYLPTLEKEYDYWMKGGGEIENVTGSNHLRVVYQEKMETSMLNRYHDNISRPRAEMYSDDLELIAEHGAEKATKMILDIRSACESGWDFSSRWCADPMKLNTIHTSDILPIDLNCLLYFLETLLAKAYRLSPRFEDNQLTAKWRQSAADERKSCIQSLFWKETTGFFHDYDFVAQKQTPSLSLAGIFPLFFKIATEEQAKSCATVIEQQFLQAGGLVTTPIESGQQWDAPNGWAPLQWIAIQGLRNYDFDELANTITKRWLSLNEKVYRQTGKMMEKYNVVDIDLESGGGEYPVQDGFGWTNGVYVALLK